MNRADETALLLLDFHHAIVAQFGDVGERAVAKAWQALQAARGAGMRVFHVIPHYRPGYPELPPGEPFDGVRTGGLFAEDRPGDGIAAALRPAAGEPVVAKSRYSPFRSNDLMAMLTVARVRSVVLAGLATSGVVLSALREAWDADLTVTVLDDACGDEADVHEMLVGKLFPRQATVIGVDAWQRRVEDSR